MWPLGSRVGAFRTNGGVDGGVAETREVLSRTQNCSFQGGDMEISLFDSEEGNMPQYLKTSTLEGMNFR